MPVTEIIRLAWSFIGRVCRTVWDIAFGMALPMYEMSGDDLESAELPIEYKE